MTVHGEIIRTIIERPPDDGDSYISCCIGVDTGTRNLAIAILTDDNIIGGKITSLFLAHYDLNVTIEEETEITSRFIEVANEVVEQLEIIFSNQTSIDIQIIFESQQKQRNDSLMARLGGVFQGILFSKVLHFASSNTFTYRVEVEMQQPVCTCTLPVQRIIFKEARKEELIKAVDKRDDKKNKCDEMMSCFLKNQGKHMIEDKFTHDLCRFNKKGQPIKTSDRRNHVSDATMHAYYWLNKKIE